jgi:hypothetical protein
MARQKRYNGSRRDAGRFVAIPFAVIDSPAYVALSHPARALVIEVARQFHGDDNGRMVLTRRHLRARGWTSTDVLQRAKVELLTAGFIFETVKGMRPNKAAWYALTWLSLDMLDGFDPGAAAGFERSAYRKNAVHVPPAGTESAVIVPRAGTGKRATVPPAGTMRAISGTRSVPPAGIPLEVPSTRRNTRGPRT